MNGDPVELVDVWDGHPRYAALLIQFADPVLAEQMWADAEHRPTPNPETTWTFAVVAGRIEAWAAVTPGQDDNGRRILRCTDHYERRGVGRDRELFRLVLDHRERRVLPRWRFPAVTYVFEPAATLLEEYGWRRTGKTDVSRQDGIEPHRWFELERPARVPRLPTIPGQLALMPADDLVVTADVAAPSPTRGQVRAARQRAAIEAGRHPLSLTRAYGLRLHPDAAPVDDPDAPGLRCGTCRFRRQVSGGTRRYPKCLWPDPDTMPRRGQLGPGMSAGWPRISNGDGTDVRAHWPACVDHQPTESVDPVTPTG